MLLDELLARARVLERRSLDWVDLTRVVLTSGGARTGHHLAGGSEEIWLMRPSTYMNSSGLGVSAGCDELQLGPSELLLAYDEIDLPLGRVRLRRSGGDGGHRGMRSVIEALETQQIPRLRLGVGGEKTPEDTADYVLTPFASEELPVVAEMIENAADAVRMILRAGLTATMNAYNPIQSSSSEGGREASSRDGSTKSSD